MRLNAQTLGYLFMRKPLYHRHSEHLAVALWQTVDELHEFFLCQHGISRNATLHIHIIQVVGQWQEFYLSLSL